VLLLDTHIWVWSVEGADRRFTPESRRRILRGESTDSVRVSPVSLLEVTYLWQAGRLHINRSVEQWIEGALHPSGIRLAELTAGIAIDAGHIPRTALSDPMDRLIVATARHLDATLVTADRAILTYARGGHVRVHDASR
jgi:PIN domain nuclease of toxin-antitoxin system